MPYLLQKQALYIMMLALMGGVILGLVAWSSWTSAHHGIIKTPEAHYDYIIVGGGTAGCVLAARLSANPRHNVLLVEAGEHFSWLSSVPLATPMLQGSAQDWAYRTKPQVHSSWGLNNQSSACPRGRGLGGSGKMNYMLHNIGSEEDFVRWEGSGAIGWGLRQLQPYISKMLGTEHKCIKQKPYCLRSYQNLLMSAAGLYTTHSAHLKSHRSFVRVKASVQPLMHISHVDVGNSVLGKVFIEAGHELAVTFKNLSFSTAHSTVFKGRRWSSLDGYLRPALGRRNLHVLLKTQVTRVVTDNGRVVQGVELRSSGDFTKFVRSRQEVMLSAGTINTPHILLQSGVGPRAHLQKHGVSLSATALSIPGL
ncbi:glucose dehydrogenase [FAD, quinone] [Cryptotermes secundus]|uniref:glucose dehydrogenase [FAD, quinone] n=1 Tax=Cryptotermes secundus TaxID=105785 RepID=UPI001454C814|nr:glucose dehydrogenase [FAD, quinone] [Cryptotermes secundus]